MMRPWSLFSSSSASPSRSASCRFATASTRGATTTRTSSSRPPLVLRRLPEALGVAPLALLVEAPLARRLRRRGSRALALRAGSLPHLLEDALHGELAVAKLGTLVLGDRAYDPAKPVEDAAAL